MATAVIHYTAAARTDRGCKRPSNEDAFAYSVEHGVFVVCDGMGGAAAGEIASSLAVDEMMRRLARPNVLNRLPADAEQAVAAANRSILIRAQRSQKLSGMGTTLVCLVVEKHHAWIFNVGDSRGYRLRGSRLEQITVDHSLVEEQMRTGRLTKSEAMRSPLRNVITRALGTQNSLTPDIFELEAEPGDLFLLCSDGLTRELPDSAIESILSAKASLDELCMRLVAVANQEGGHDNITCLLARAEA